jgi:hypothetical protein
LDNGNHDDGDDDVLRHICKRQRIIERDEFKEYLNAPLVPAETDILQWWKANTAVYRTRAWRRWPERDYLAIPATGAPAQWSGSSPAAPI